MEKVSSLWYYSIKYVSDNGVYTILLVIVLMGIV